MMADPHRPPAESRSFRMKKDAVPVKTGSVQWTRETRLDGMCASAVFCSQYAREEQRTAS
jgi:hypothetical protein